jgi:hypothetical protein
VVQGRSLRGSADEPEQVVVINEALAARFWPDRNPIGREILGPGGTPWSVVGVVRDVQMRSLRSAANPAVYYPLHHAWDANLVIHARVEGPTGTAVRELRRVVATLDPELPLGSVVDLRVATSDSIREVRVFGLLVGGFALLSLILAAIGLYGLVAYGVAQRVREMGIRLALGARPESLVGLVLRRSLVVAGIGVLAGLALALALGKALGGLLFGVEAGSPPVLLAAAGFLFGTALLAAWLPARRASRVDATVSLKAE